jgi:phosphatidylglycerophosphate synthase
MTRQTDDLHFGNHAILISQKIRPLTLKVRAKSAFGFRILDALRHLMQGYLSKYKDEPALSPAQIPNVLSGLRIASTPVLLLLAYMKQQEIYAWLLAGALISDILDGAIARTFGYVSQLGARLDSIADILIFMAAACGIWRFYPDVVTDHKLALAVIVILWFGGSLAGFWRYGRLASFHTYLSRITAYAMGLFLAILFLWGFEPWLLRIIVSLVIVSQLEELLMMALLPTWSPNARGLYWVVARRTKRE